MLVLLAILFTINLYGRINIFNTSYILHKQFRQILQDQYWPFILKLKTTLFNLLSFVFIYCTTRCHSLSFNVTCCTSRSHSLSLVVPIVVTRCNTCLSFSKRSCLCLFLKKFQINSNIQCKNLQLSLPINNVLWTIKA